MLPQHGHTHKPGTNRRQLVVVDADTLDEVARPATANVAGFTWRPGSPS